MSIIALGREHSNFMPSLNMNNNTQKPLFAMVVRSLRPRANMFSPSTRFLLSSQQPRRTLIPPPSEKAGPLMERRSDRELPPLPNLNRWFKTFPIFVAIMIASTLAIFNYEKSTSSIVSATLYALRTSDTGREVLGENIYFRDRFPWIWGKINQLHGNIDIRFAVKGTKGEGMMRFRSIRRTRMGYFQTQEWSLKMEDGRIIELMDDENSADPFANTSLQAGATS